jgi:predicted nucleic acid-binding protein
VISYFDTSLLIKLYVFEDRSDEVADIVGRGDFEPMISWLSVVEMASGLHRRMAAPTDRLAEVAYSEFQNDRRRGIYTVVGVDLEAIELACTLGEKYGKELNLRALDILHVAIALRHGAVSFGTFDQRQARLAVATGLKIVR